MSSSKNYAFYPIIKNLYQRAIICGTIAGTLYGIKTGYTMSKTICFQKNDLTRTEYAGEVFCFSGIVLSSGGLYGLISGLAVATTPVTLPMFLVSKIYKMSTNDN